MWEMQRAHVTDYLVGADQNIPDWLIDFFPVEVETAGRSGAKSRFGMGFSTRDTIWGFWFSL